MPERPAFLDNALIVAAHADDEVLWFNSILPRVDHVIVVYREFWADRQIGRRRAKALAEHPHPNVTCLDVDESGVYGCAGWTAPQTSPFGLALGYEAGRRALTRLARKSVARLSAGRGGGVAPETVSAAYERNYAIIRDRLRPLLRTDMNVFTHNPWGEYGHEEHVQVFRALDELRGEIGFRLWMSNYCTERALPLAMRYFAADPGGYVRLPADKAFADRVADVYKAHGCWTWDDDWAWFDEECFMEAPRCLADAGAHAHLFPLNLFRIDAPQGREWLPIALTVSAASAALGFTLSEVM